MDSNRTTVLLEVLLSQIRCLNMSLEELRAEMQNLRTDSNQRYDEMQKQLIDLCALDRHEHQQLIQMARKSRLRSNR